MSNSYQSKQALPKEYYYDQLMFQQWLKKIMSQNHSWRAIRYIYNTGYVLAFIVWLTVFWGVYSGSKDSLRVIRGFVSATIVALMIFIVAWYGKRKTYEELASPFIAWSFKNRNPILEISKTGIKLMYEEREEDHMFAGFNSTRSSACNPAVWKISFENITTTLVDKDNQRLFLYGKIDCNVNSERKTHLPVKKTLLGRTLSALDDLLFGPDETPISQLETKGVLVIPLCFENYQQFLADLHEVLVLSPN